MTGRLCLPFYFNIIKSVFWFDLFCFVIFSLFCFSRGHNWDIVTIILLCIINSLSRKYNSHGIVTVCECHSRRSWRISLTRRWCLSPLRVSTTGTEVAPVHNTFSGPETSLKHTTMLLSSFCYTDSAKDVNEKASCKYAIQWVFTFSRSVHITLMELYLLPCRRSKQCPLGFAQRRPAGCSELPRSQGDWV